MSAQKILMIIAPEGFRDEEYNIPKDIFEENGFKVETCSKNVEVAVGKLGQETDIDIDISKVEISNYCAIVFVGGPGALDYTDDEDALRISRETFHNKKKVISAICIAPMILFSAGILEGKDVTVWDKDKKQSEILLENGVNYLDDKVVEDGNLVTASGPEVAALFAETIIEKIEEFLSK